MLPGASPEQTPVREISCFWPRSGATASIVSRWHREMGEDEQVAGDERVHVHVPCIRRRAARDDGQRSVSPSRSAAETPRCLIAFP
jgi:hypothetical protein